MIKLKSKEPFPWKDRFLRLQPALAGIGMQMFNSLMAFLVGVLLARGLGPEGFGQFSYVYAWVLLGANLIQAGLPPLLIREIASYQGEGRSDLSNGIIALAQRLVLTVAALAIGFALACYQLGLLDGAQGPLLLAGMPALAFLTLSSVREAATRGLGGVLIGQVSELLIRPGANLALLLLLLAGFWPLVPLNAMLAFSAACAAALLFSSLNLRQRRRPIASVAPRYDTATWLPGFWKMSAIGWIEAINIQASVIILGAFMTAKEVGDYRVAAQVALLMLVMIKVLMAIQGPVLSAAYSRGAAGEMQHLSTRSSVVCTLFAAPFLLVSVSFGEELVALIFGSAYVSAVTAFQILALGQLVSALGGTVNTLAYATRSEAAMLAMQLGMLAINLGLSLWLAPRYGSIGAATAVAVSTVAFKAGLIFLVYRNTGVLALPIRKGV